MDRASAAVAVGAGSPSWRSNDGPGPFASAAMLAAWSRQSSATQMAADGGAAPSRPGDTLGLSPWDPAGYTLASESDLDSFEDSVEDDENVEDYVNWTGSARCGPCGLGWLARRGRYGLVEHALRSRNSFNGCF